MSADLLDELRRADPVDRDTVQISPAVAARVLNLRPRRSRRRAPGALVLFGGVAVAAAIVIALLLGRGGAGDLAARAYAAVSAPGIVHWQTDLATSAGGRPPVRQRIEGWSLGTTTHTLGEDVIHGKPHVTIDARTVGRRSRAWLSSSDDWSTTTLPKGRRPVEPVPTGDPLAAFRRAYRADRLRDLGHGRFEVIFPHLPAGAVIYQVDPSTGRPRRLTIRDRQPAAAGRPTRETITTVTFTVYETLPVTAVNRAKLQLLSHPGAGPGTEDPARYFAALRTGTVPSGPEAGQVRGLARNMSRYRINPDGIRPVADGVWLLPGRGYICLAVVTPPLGSSGGLGGVGGGCVTVRKALRSGVSVGTVRVSGTRQDMQVTVAVPDGVRAIQARRYWHGPWRSFPVAGGLARLPGLSWQIRLVR
jgi:hypothetical protein